MKSLMEMFRIIKEKAALIEEAEKPRMDHEYIKGMSPFMEMKIREHFAQKKAEEDGKVS